MEKAPQQTVSTAVHDDAWLLQQVASGSKDAYKTLFIRYQPILFRYLQPFKSVEDPDEVIQDIFLKLWIKKEALTAIHSFQQYIFRMARNRLLDKQKSTRARQQRETAITPTIPGNESSILQAVEYKEFYTHALQVICRLPQRQRRIYELSVFHDLSLEEIGKALGISKAVVIKQLYLANKAVRREVQKFIHLLLLILLCCFL